MKKILSLLFLFSFFGYGQTIKTKEITYNFSDGKAFFSVCIDDHNIEFDENLEYRWYNEYSGIQKSKGGAGGKLLHGKYQAFNDEGALRYEKHYFLGLQDGVQKEWDNDGNLVEIYKYKKGICYYTKFKENDNFIEWIGEGGHLEKGFIENVYDLTGTLISKSVSLGNLREKVTNYYYNGQIKEKYSQNRVIGVIGEYVSYYRNGSVKVKGSTDETATRIGEWYWYNEDGTIDSIEKYRISKTFYPNGKLKEKWGEFYDNEINEWIKNGSDLYYQSDGLLKERLVYQYGKLVEKF